MQRPTPENRSQTANGVTAYWGAVVLSSPALNIEDIGVNLKRWLIATLVVTICGCGGGRDVQEPPEQPPEVPPFEVSAEAESMVGVNRVITLKAEAHSDATFEWRQTQGAAVLWPEGDVGASVTVIAPAEASELEFELTAQSGERSARAQVMVSVRGCDAQPGEVFGDCLSSEFGPILAFASSPTTAGLYFNGDAPRHVQWHFVDTGDAEHGQVIEIRWNANDPNHEVDANGWFGVAMRDESQLGPKDLSRYAQGTLQFDMRLIHHEMPNSPSPFDLKLECEYPCVSDYFAIAGVESRYEWQTYRFSVAQMIETGLDIQKVNHALVIHPRWAAQEQSVSVQIDNIRFLTDYQPPEREDGCTGSGTVSYHLARAANPNADQQEAYNLIVEAMDVAVAKYNCYTDLGRALYIEYNPGVATADGNPNGTIRFGSRASMHHVTAMHEISHVFGVGASNYRPLVVEGTYTGAKATAKLRELTGDPDAQLRSDGTHLWPYGLNYISEGGSEEDLRNHCLIVEAVVADLRG